MSSNPFKDFQSDQIQRSSRKIFTAHYACRNADLNLTLVTGTANGFVFQIINSLLESWGVRLTWLDCNHLFVTLHTYAVYTRRIMPIVISLLTDDQPSPRKGVKLLGSTSPTLFEKLCGFFYVPQESEKFKCFETKPTLSLSKKTKTSNRL